jgi:hypothetical protein
VWETGALQRLDQYVASSPISACRPIRRPPPPFGLWRDRRLPSSKIAREIWGSDIFYNFPNGSTGDWKSSNQVDGGSRSRRTDSMEAIAIRLPATVSEGHLSDRVH